MTSIISNPKRAFAWLGTLVAVAAVAAGGVYAGGWSGPANSSIAHANGGSHATSLRYSISGGSVTLTWQPPASVSPGSSVSYEVTRRAGDQSQRLGTTAATTYVDQPGSSYHCQELSYIVVTLVDGVAQSPSLSATPGTFNPEGRDCSPDPAPEAEDATTDETSDADPPEKVVCFYEKDGEIHTVSLPECSAEALAGVWEGMN